MSAITGDHRYTALVGALMYPYQTEILEGRTNLSECIFEALFKGVSTRFGLHEQLTSRATCESV
jgi:hypothetical protein